MQISSPVPHKRARIEIIPLIDIMFFLLASFMMVSLSQTHMKGIRVNLPAAVGPPPSGVKDFVSVKVLEGNAVFFDNQYVEDGQVLPRLFQLHRANPGIKISLSATPMAMYGDVIAVLDKIRISGITKVGYQIRAAGGVTQTGSAPPAGAPPPPPPPPPSPSLLNSSCRRSIPWARTALARWLMVVFTATGSSPKLCSNPSGMKIGS